MMEGGKGAVEERREDTEDSTAAKSTVTDTDT